MMPLWVCVVRRVARMCGHKWHSPSLAIIGTCRCKPCSKARDAAHRKGEPFGLAEWQRKWIAEWNKEA